jgi:peptidoglycan/LPS O-acetylase OafA/YrhL
MRRLTPPKARLPFTLQGSVVLGILATALIGAVWLLLSLELMPAAFFTGAPIAATSFGVLWSLAALLRKRPRSFVFAAAWLGASLSLLLAAQGIAEVSHTLIGLVLIAVGVAMVLRGLLMADVPQR